MNTNTYTRTRSTHSQIGDEYSVCTSTDYTDTEEAEIYTYIE